MSSLNQGIQNAADALRRVKSHLERVRELPKKTFARSIYDDWERIARFSQKLDDTLPFLEKRDIAEAALRDFDMLIKHDEDKELNECIMRSGRVEMSVAIARDMALSDYVMQTWIIYDRITNVVGRIVGPVEISRNETAANNPKLLRYLVKAGGGKERPLVGSFSIDEYLKDSYAWQIIAASRIRNTISHDGGYINDKPLFKDNLVREMFNLDVDAVSELNSGLERDTGKRAELQLLARDGSFSFSSADIRPQLKLLHEEVDCAVALLIGWACDAFVDLVRHFSHFERGPAVTVWL